MRIEGWYPDQVIEILTNATRPRLKEAAEVIAANVRLHCPVGTKARPMYKRGMYANQPWTSRDNGRLRQSVRVVYRKGKPLNARIYAGDAVRNSGQGKWLAYYGRIVEFYTPFFRPAWYAAMPRVKEILGAK
jgi:hypothetical protein